MNYYDIDDILAEEERVPITFRNEGYNLGWLDPGSNEEHLKSETKVDLPIWLGKILKNHAYVDLELPLHYKANYRSRLEADPIIVSLAKYYYNVGLYVATTSNDRELLELLQRVFATRYRDILDKSQHWRNADFSEFTKKLSECEKKLFEAGYTTAVEMERWKGRKVEEITASSVIDINKKRKRDDL